MYDSMNDVHNHQKSTQKFKISDEGLEVNHRIISAKREIEAWTRSKNPKKCRYLQYDFKLGQDRRCFVFSKDTATKLPHLYPPSCYLHATSSYLHTHVNNNYYYLSSVNSFTCNTLEVRVIRCTAIYLY